MTTLGADKKQAMVNFRKQRGHKARTNSLKCVVSSV